MPIEEVQIPEGKDETPQPERRPRKKQPGSAKLQDQVAELYTTIGMVIVAPIDRLAGTLLVEQSEDLAEQWVKLAETNPQVKKVLLKLVEAGGWGGIVIAHGMIALPVLANRGLFPDQVAAGIATATMLAYPDTGPFFDHPRWQQQPATNGNGNVTRPWEGEEKGPVDS